jgi:hypothetical protein
VGGGDNLSELKQKIRLAIEALDRCAIADARRHLEAALQEEEVSVWQLRFAYGDNKINLSVYSTVGWLMASINVCSCWKGRRILEGAIITSPQGEEISFKDFCINQKWIPTWSWYAWQHVGGRPDWMKEIEQNGK